MRFCSIDKDLFLKYNVSKMLIYSGQKKGTNIFPISAYDESEKR